MLTTRSRQKLQGVHPDLVRVVERADALLGDGAGAYSGLYDAGDHVHVNNAGEALLASTFAARLNEP